MCRQTTAGRGSAHRMRLRQAQATAAGNIVGILEAQHPRRRMQDTAREDSGLDLRRRHETALTANGARRQAADHRQVAGFVQENVRGFLDEHRLSALGLGKDRDEVPHRPTQY